MTMDPIRERWRDLSSGADGPGRAGQAGAEESPLESVAGSLFRAAPPTRPRTPQAASSLLAKLREQRQPWVASWWQRVFGIRRLAIALSMFFSVNLAMALTLSPVKQWWLRALQVGHVNAPTARSWHPSRPAAPAIEMASDLVGPLVEDVHLQAPPEAPAEAPALSPPRRHVRAPIASRETETAPPPPAPITAVPEPAADALAGESELLSRALGDLGAGRPAQALTELASYHQRFPHGSLAYEATLAEVKAEVATGQDGRALAALEGAMAMPGFENLPRSSELVLLRAELQARARDCAQALATFDRLASSEELDPPLAERALYGRASCLVTQGDRAGSRRALQAYLRRFPSGRFASTVRAALATQE